MFSLLEELRGVGMDEVEVGVGSQGLEWLGWGIGGGGGADK